MDIKVSSVLNELTWFSAETALLSGTIIGGISLAVQTVQQSIPYMGFSSSGIVKGSPAAMYQSLVLGGQMVTGSLFSKLQRCGMTGSVFEIPALTAATKTSIVEAVAAVVGVSRLSESQDSTEIWKSLEDYVYSETWKHTACREEFDYEIPYLQV